MENKKISLQDAETTAMDPQNSGKGKLLYEIGMGLVGEIIAIGIAFGITMFLSELDSCHGDGSMGGLLYLFVIFPAISVLFAIPLVCECVRFGGMRSGGHKRRRGCYTGIAVGILLALLGFALGALYMLWVCLINLLVGAIVGYRRDAS